MMAEELRRDVEQFLYREARLLDERRFHEWLELFTDDVRYWMAGRNNRYPRSSKAITVLGPDPRREADLDIEEEMPILDETKVTLEGRVARLDTGMAWGEDPSFLMRHLPPRSTLFPYTTLFRLEFARHRLDHRDP